MVIPHYCCSCGRIGHILCEYCKYDIVNETFSGCVLCRKPCSPSKGVCGLCKTSYTKAWCVGERLESLERVINLVKFERLKGANNTLAELLDAVLPVLPDDTTIVSVPTTNKHIRIRGYDHMKLIAKRFARMRGLKYEELLQKTNNSAQLGSKRRQRIEQAKKSYKASRDVKGGPYLLIDDVITTGATVEYASRALLEAGADEVWVASVSRQPIK